MTLYVVRHAKAGSRSAWRRPTTCARSPSPGASRPPRLADAAHHAGITRILSSPYVRCRQTVEPLGEQIRLAVDLSDALAEGAAIVDTLGCSTSSVTRRPCSARTAMWWASCSGTAAIRVSTPVTSRWRRAPTWVFETEAGAIVDAQYVPPPE